MIHLTYTRALAVSGPAARARPGTVTEAAALAVGPDIGLAAGHSAA